MGGEAIEGAADPQSALREAEDRIAQGDHSAADALLAAAMERWPRALPLVLAAARSKDAAGDTAGAEACYLAAHDAFPQSAHPALMLTRLQLRLGRGDDAARSLDLARARGLDRLAAHRMAISVARSRGDWAAMRIAAEQLVAAGAEPMAAALTALAQACQGEGDVAGAERAAADLLAIEPQSVTARRIGVWAAQQKGDGDAALSHYRGLSESSPNAPREAAKAVRLLSLLGRPEEAADAFDEAFARWPADPQLRLFAMMMGSSRLWLPTVLAASEAPPAAGAAARSIAEEAKVLRRVWDNRPPDSALLRPVVDDQPASEVMVAQGARGGPAVVVFTDASDQCGGLPCAVLDRYFAARDVTAIYVRDFRRMFFLRGIGSLGADYEETQAALARLVSEHGATSFRTAGLSGGGLSAVRYGVEMGATHVVSFSGDTNRRGKGGIDRIPDPDLRMVAQRIRADTPLELLDVTPLLAGRETLPIMTFAYGQENERDREQASYVAGFPGVRLHPIAGLSEHRVATRMAGEPGFAAFLDEALGLR